MNRVNLFTVIVWQPYLKYYYYFFYTLVSLWSVPILYCSLVPSPTCVLASVCIVHYIEKPSVWLVPGLEKITNLCWLKMIEFNSKAPGQYLKQITFNFVLNYFQMAYLRPSWYLIPAITFNRSLERDRMTHKGRQGESNEAVREIQSTVQLLPIPSLHVKTLDVCELHEEWCCDSLIKLKGLCCRASDLHLRLSWSDIY